MFNKKTCDWKYCLADEDKEVLASIFEAAKRHKCAYCCADDVSTAQLWCALLEMKKEFNQLKEDSEKVQLPFRAIAEIGEIQKRKTIEQLIKQMIKPEPDQEDATQKLVNSLMKF
jgi:hypothetical protein